MTEMAAVDPASKPVPAPRRAWFGLAALVLPVLLVSLDISVLFLALPTMTVDLDPTAAQQLWILDIYGFLLAGLLITMGNLGDRIGRRRILLIGAFVFGLASVVAAFAPTPEVLIAARAFMGIGGATLMPSSLSLISTLFAEPKQRATAIGIWTAFFAGGAAVGPIIGGVLLHHFWWGSVFLINVPVLVLLLLVGPILLPEHRGGAVGPLDTWSVLLSIGGILPLVYSVKYVAEHGLDVEGVSVGVLGAVIFTLFIRRQRQLDEPLLDLALFRRPRFSVAIGSSLSGTMSLAAMSYLVNVYLQSVTGRDPLLAALLGIPMASAVFVFAMIGAPLGHRFGTRITFAVSLVLAAVGNMLLLGLTPDGGIIWYLVGSTIAGMGYGIVFTLVSEVAVSSVPPQRAGSAVGISETSFELGNALGLALLGSLATVIFSAGGDFSPTVGETIRDAGDNPAVVAAAKESFVQGLQVATTVGAGIVLAMALVALLVLPPGRQRTSRTAAGPDDEQLSDLNQAGA